MIAFTRSYKSHLFWSGKKMVDCLFSGACLDQVNNLFCKVEKGYQSSPSKQSATLKLMLCFCLARRCTPSLFSSLWHNMIAFKNNIKLFRRTKVCTKKHWYAHILTCFAVHNATICKIIVEQLLSCKVCFGSFSVSVSYRLLGFIMEFIPFSDAAIKDDQKQWEIFFKESLRKSRQRG